MSILRTIVACAVVFGSLAFSSDVALAGRDWCDGDPVFVIAGVGTIHVTARWSDDADPSALTLVLDVPSNVSGSVNIPASAPVPTTATISPRLPDWNGSGAMPAVLHAKLTASRGYEVEVRVSGSATARARGDTNRTLNIRLSIGAGSGG